MIYFVPFWMLPFVLMARGFVFMVKAFLIGCWAIMIAVGWLTRWCYDRLFPPKPEPEWPYPVRDEWVIVRTAARAAKPGICPKCGQPAHSGHLGTCPHSTMHGGQPDTAVYPSEQPTVEFWPGERGRVPPA